MVVEDESSYSNSCYRPSSFVVLAAFFFNHLSVICNLSHLFAFQFAFQVSTMAASGIYLFSIVAATFFLTVANAVDVATSNNGVGESFNCPAEVCRCGLDPRGRVKVVCDRGDLGDPIPIRAMDPLTEVLIISAPDDKPNSLTIGPIFQVSVELKLSLNLRREKK